MNATIRIAEDIAGRLGEVPGVDAVALGGSWARGEARPHSDVDLGLYYRPDVPPDVEGLRHLARDLDDRHLPELATDVGAWGPWINGGGWLRVAGTPVDWLYRDAGKVRATVERCSTVVPSVITSRDTPTTSTSTYTPGRSITAGSSTTPRISCGI